jgi:hypothetical protein
MRAAGKNGGERESLFFSPARGRPRKASGCGGYAEEKSLYGMPKILRCEVPG